MATVTLGNIKFNWKGPYNNSTAYVVDDVVSSGGSSYVCILASTGNAVSNGTYWQQMSSAGTDGTDLTSTLTTQGDIVYRDASGLARLGAGTSGQVLQTGGTGANPSWTTMSSDYVKIAGGTHSGTALTIDNCFTSDYTHYKLFLYDAKGTSYVRFQYRTGGASGSTESASEYRYTTRMYYRNSSAQGATGEHGWNDTSTRIGWVAGTSTKPQVIEMYVSDPYSNTSKTLAHGLHSVTNDTYVAVAYWGAMSNQSETTRYTGIRWFMNDNATFTAKYAVYGIKT